MYKRNQNIFHKQKVEKSKLVLQSIMHVPAKSTLILKKTLLETVHTLTVTNYLITFMAYLALHQYPILSTLKTKVLLPI